MVRTKWIITTTTFEAFWNIQHVNSPIKSGSQPALARLGCSLAPRPVTSRNTRATTHVLLECDRMSSANVKSGANDRTSSSTADVGSNTRVACSTVAVRYRWNRTRGVPLDIRDTYLRRRSIKCSSNTVPHLASLGTTNVPISNSDGTSTANEND